MANERLFITVKIPVKNHVKKYLSVRYGIEHTLTKTSLLGMLLFYSLEKRIERQKASISEYDGNYHILVSQYYMNQKGFSVDMKTRKFIAVCFEKLFMEDMNGFVDKCIGQMNQSAMSSLKIFLKTYEISEDDVKIESLYRQYQRYSKENIRHKKKKTA